ncbi:cell division protein FtsB, partial [Achromobacter xylosoxidans]
TPARASAPAARPAATPPKPANQANTRH